MLRHWTALLLVSLASTPAIASEDGKTVEQTTDQDQGKNSGIVSGMVKKKIVKKKVKGDAKPGGAADDPLFTEFHFNKVSLGGRIKTPQVSFIKDGQDGFEPDFIRIRTRWSEEMVGSATNLENDGDDTVWELFYTLD